MIKPTQPEKLGFSPDRLTRINDFMERYVNEEKIAGFVTLVARRGEIAYVDKFGYQNLAAKTPIELDTIFRIYSMTKPITSVAFMMLFERGLVRLEDPVSKFIPEFKHTRVYGEGGVLVDPVREITVHDLLNHTAGLIYGGIEGAENPVNALYNKAGLFDPNIDLQEMVRRIAELPLAFQPGTAWHYSVITDVVGHLIERITDKPLPDVLREKIFKPLGMVDTAFSVPDQKETRLSTLYGKTDENDLAVLDETIGGNYFKVKLHLGGSGLVSTISDYYTFSQMVLNRGEIGGGEIPSHCHLYRYGVIRTSLELPISPS